MNLLEKARGLLGRHRPSTPVVQQLQSAVADVEREMAADADTERLDLIRRRADAREEGERIGLEYRARTEAHDKRIAELRGAIERERIARQGVDAEASYHSSATDRAVAGIDKRLAELQPPSIEEFQRYAQAREREIRSSLSGRNEQGVDGQLYQMASNHAAVEAALEVVRELRTEVLALRYVGLSIADVDARVASARDRLPTVESVRAGSAMVEHAPVRALPRW